MSRIGKRASPGSLRRHGHRRGPDRQGEGSQGRMQLVLHDEVVAKMEEGGIKV